MLWNMTIRRIDDVLIVVDDLEAVKALFVELGMELEGETSVEGRWVDRVVGLSDVPADLAMMRTADGHSPVELTNFHTPPAVRAEPKSAPANTRLIGRSPKWILNASSAFVQPRVLVHCGTAFWIAR